MFAPEKLQKQLMVNDFHSIPKNRSNEQSPLQAINELLSISNIPIEITLGKR